MPKPTTATFCSPSQSICAVADAEAWVTTVYRVNKQTGERKRLWAMYGWSSFIAVHNDGEHLVVVNWLTANLSAPCKRNESMFHIVRRGDIIRTVTLDQMIDDITKSPRSVSHYQWGHYEGIDSAGRFIIKTFEHKLAFDPVNGTRLSKL